MFNKKEYVKQYTKQYRKDNPKKIKKYRRQYYLNNREKVINETKECKLKRLYGLSHEDWLKMWEKQDEKCLICGKKFIKPSNACVDHNHKTGEVRGLLCRHCNSIIGFLENNPRLMMNSIEYLLGEE
ncbi:hypothetical protein CVT91_00185 [Candidatus Atribacteria bacterium HGW-Atribacteria-1]|nr:MAG: hypothetical protein CVT91_00185 [Candidatus Atribacteria bacterium HGW-Atribacteria-1]